MELFNGLRILINALSGIVPQGSHGLGPCDRVKAFFSFVNLLGSAMLVLSSYLPMDQISLTVQKKNFIR